MLLLLPASSAWAGRVWATGHDADFHCNGGGPQCHYLSTALNYVRAAAPDPTKKVLVVDNNGLELDNSLTAFGIPHDTIDPSSPAFGTTPFSTDTYSAIAVASDASCGGCDLNQSGTSDSDAINARAGDFSAFFNAGGGVLALAGARHGGNSTSSPNVYYNFMPLPVGGVAVTNPFCLTPDGAFLGLEDPAGCPDAAKHTGTHDDINCCATHNSFTKPDPSSAVKVAETDAADLAETLFAEGVISGGKIVGAAPGPSAPVTAPLTPAPVPQAVVPSKASISVLGVRTACVSTSFRPTVNIRAPAGVKTITVSVDGRRVKTSKKSKFTLAISVRKLKAGRHRITVVAVDSRNRTTTQQRSFFRCAQKAAAKQPQFTG
jgi:hypothetical protein